MGNTDSGVEHWLKADTEPRILITFRTKKINWAKTTQECVTSVYWKLNEWRWLGAIEMMNKRILYDK